MSLSAIAAGTASVSTVAPLTAWLPLNGARAVRCRAVNPSGLYALNIIIEFSDDMTHADAETAAAEAGPTQQASRVVGTDGHAYVRMCAFSDPSAEYPAIAGVTYEVAIAEGSSNPAIL